MDSLFLLDLTPKRGFELLEVSILILMDSLFLHSVLLHEELLPKSSQSLF